jgi:hypothetical protein
MWKQIMRYLYLAKKDPNAPDNMNVKFMHGMNRISIFMFLFAVVVMIIRAFTRS